MKSFTLPVRFPGPGQFQVTIEAGENYLPQFPEDLAVVLEASDAHHPTFRMFGDAYFFVPPDTERILLKTTDRFSVIAPGETARTDYSVEDEDPTLECIVIPVEDGQAGKVWTLASHTAGAGYFLNIPPYLAPRPDKILVPAGMPETAPDGDH